MLYLDVPYHLPEDVLFKEILPKLPVRSLCRFKCVSKSWSARISGDPTFVADHLHHHSNTTGEPNIIVRSRSSDGKKLASKLFLLEDHSSEPVENFDISYINEARKKTTSGFTLVGCCNGLVCLRIFSDDDDTAPLVFWNPATREFRYLPQPTMIDSMPSVLRYETNIDMGFDEQGNDYKIVRIEEVAIRYEAQKLLAVQLFTKSSGSWRQLEDVAGYGVRALCKGLQVDGALHWPVVSYHESTPARGAVFRILSFDLRSEELRVVEGPVSTSSDVCYHNLVLTKWKGSLGALTFVREMECEVWLRTRNDNYNNYCWTKMFNIHNLSMPSWSIRSRIGDKFICFESYKTQDVFMYDPFTHKRTDFHEQVGRVIDGFDYFQTLVSPN